MSAVVTSDFWESTIGDVQETCKTCRFFTLRERRAYPISLVARGSASASGGQPHAEPAEGHALDLEHPRHLQR